VPRFGWPWTQVPADWYGHGVPELARAIEVLLAEPGVIRLDEAGRTNMTVRCRDTDGIAKVPNAGELVKLSDGTEAQIMHNGVLVEAGGYFGDWMAGIIKELRGHHEPQEEVAFDALVRRVREGGRMIEFGSWWSYYSLWFAKSVPSAQNICCEPDPDNLALGIRNAKLNDLEPTFLQGAAGPTHREQITFRTEVTGIDVSVPTLTVDGLLAEHGWGNLDLLHVDVQGHELDALQGALGAIQGGKIRFVVVSTHHWSISGEPDTHADCLRFFAEQGAHIIASHTVAESYSGDGVIVASFDPMDDDLEVEMSINHTDQSLFRPHEEDLAILARALGRYVDMNVGVASSQWV
jgi:FkbM family methyltransferase